MAGVASGNAIFHMNSKSCLFVEEWTFYNFLMYIFNIAGNYLCLYFVFFILFNCVQLFCFHILLCFCVLIFYIIIERVSFNFEALDLIKLYLI